MSTVAIYVEGGGEGAGARAALRRGFNAFLEDQKRAAESRGWRWKLACVGSRNDAFRAFQHATQRATADVVVLMVDAEGQAGRGSLAHLRQRNSLPRATDLESVPKRDIERKLKAATRNTTKGEYHKIRHASQLLAQISPRRVRERCERCGRLMDYLTLTLV